jgi:hypothetical protein
MTGKKCINEAKPGSDFCRKHRNCKDKFERIMLGSIKIQR